MKKLVYAMLALVAMSFTSCELFGIGQKGGDQDTITTTVDSLKIDSTAQVDVAPEAEKPADEAQAEAAAPAEDKAEATEAAKPEEVKK